MAPPKMNFQSGFLNDTSDLDESKLDDSLRSFMDKGETVFESEEGRADVIKGVRDTLLVKMREENRSSAEDADKVEQEHIRYSDQTMIPLIAKAKRSKRDADLAYAEFLLAKSRVSESDANEAQEEIDRMVSGARAEKEAIDFRHLNVSFEDQGSESNAGSMDSGLPGADAVNGSFDESVDESLNMGFDAESGANGNESEDVEADEGESVEARMERSMDYYRLTDIQAQITQIHSNPLSRTRKFFGRVNSKMNKARSKADKAADDNLNLKMEITACSERWSEIRNRYRETTFKKHYKAYDDLAATYYRFTRQLEGKDERTIDQVNSNLGGGSASKQIAEYTGIYDEAQIEDIANTINAKPYSPDPELKRVKNKALGENSVNTESADRPMKYHRAIVMNAFAEGVSNVNDEREKKTNRVRMKLLNNFRGYTARSQYANRAGTAMTDTGISASDRGKTSDLAAASEMNLVADERAKNGSYLVSENSAKIYTARTKTIGGQEVKGFFHNGQFISSDYTAMQDQSQSSMFRSPNWKEAAEEEQVRMAIRRSDFFDHINSGTIQYYMTYNAEEQFEKVKVQDALKKANEKTEIPDTMLAMKLLDAYVDPTSDAATDLQAGHDGPTLTRLSNVVAAAAANDKKFASQLGILLLAEDDPALWSIAVELATALGGRYAARLKGIPTSGEVMRMTLLEEFANDRAFDWTNILTSARPDRLNMHIEDLDARRAGFFSLTNLRQSFWDGTLLGTISGTFGAASKDVKKMKFDGDIKTVTAGFKKDYANLVSATSTNVAFFVPAIPLIVEKATTNFELDDGKVSEETETTMNAIATAQSTLGFIQDIAKLVDQIKKLRNNAKKGEPVGPVIEKLLKTVVDLISDVLDIIGYWLDAAAFKAVTSVFGIIKDIFGLARNIVTTVRTTIEINKIKESEAEVSTALTDYKKKEGILNAGNPDAAISESRLATSSEKMGFSATQNSQGQYFLTLAKSRARRARKDAISGIVSKSIDAIASGLSFGSDVAAWFNPIAFPFKLAGKVSSFIGWSIGKLHDSDHFYENIAAALGNPGYADLAGFDAALKRETGIRNRHYLVDLARIFMAIDTHHLVRKADKTDGETALAINLMQPYIEMAGKGDERFEDPLLKGENLERFKYVKLQKLLEAVGGPGNWRAVLRSSITR